MHMSALIVPMQGVNLFYIDNVGNAENKMAAVVSSLGRGLAPLSNECMTLA